MPLPIVPINNEMEKNYFVDFSFLAKQVDKSHMDKKAFGKFTYATDEEADILMKIWAESERRSDTEDKYLKISPASKVAANDLQRLSRKGLISLDKDEIIFTDKGKSVITLMVMGEDNSFKKDQKKKSYTEILASVSKKNKSGYRIPKFHSLGHLIR